MALERRKLDPNRLTPVLTEKWSAELLSEGFTPMPKRLLRCMTELLPNKNGLELLTVILAVVDYKRPNLNRLPSVEYLAHIAGMSVERFDRVLDELAKKRWITKKGSEDAIEIDIEPFEKHVLKMTNED